jgi:hypothetical protein
MATSGHECFHCKQWIPVGVEHDCWSTTEQALTKDLPEDLRDAWERLRETAAEFGDQRVYASHHSIMFSRKACYFFVRPQKNRLEVVFFLDREVRGPQIRKVVESSRVKRAHLVHIIHRDQVEPPFTGWLRDAYGLEDRLAAAPRAAKKAAKPRSGKTRASTKKRPAKTRPPKTRAAKTRPPRPAPKREAASGRLKTRRVRAR